jgi:tRNA U34 5-methylaminomethyl-2-thiouridine-forming methyltransferase MnmC
LPETGAQLNLELVLTSDGSHTLFNPELNEHYHSIHGAVQESALVYIKNGLDYCKGDSLNIFEAGFGTGLNALLTAVSENVSKRIIHYTSIEKYPVPEGIINQLNHWNFTATKVREIFDRIHQAGWGSFEKITPYFFIKKIKCDLVKDPVEGKFGLIYFDAFGPSKQPDIWTGNVFGKIAEITLPGGVFVTYSAKGEVKRMLKSNGFKVEMLPGPPGKREMIRAIKLKK